MSLLQCVRKSLGIFGLILAAPTFLPAQSTNFVPQGVEFAPAGALAGDQTQASLGLNTNGGFIVWQDNITDGNGLGISAIKLNSSFSSPLGAFRINQNATNDQQNPHVALLKNGGAAFVWQSGKQSFQHIYARFLTSSNTFLTGDVQVNTATNKYQQDSAIATLTNGNVIIVWASRGQDNTDGSLGVYGQILTPAGAKVGSEFLVNQFTKFNQRTPAVSALPNGNFVVAWISEQESSAPGVSTNGVVNSTHSSVDVYARVFKIGGASQGNEFPVDTTTNICANPSVAAASDSSYFIAWSQKDLSNSNNGWDVCGRQFSSSGTGSTMELINSQQYGDQFAPKVTSLGLEYLVAWTSMGQDGSKEGVFGQFLRSDGSHDGDEFQVNTTVLNGQKFPAVATDGLSRFLVVWSSFVGGINSMDLYAQAYIKGSLQTLPAPGAPMVEAMDANSVAVTWPPVSGFNVAYYNLYLDGSSTPVTVSNIMWATHGFTPASTHSFQLSYVVTSGKASPLSSATTATTWGADANADGLPDNWQAKYWGSNSANWPAPGTVLAPGVTVMKVYQWGADPTKPNTWLRQALSHTTQGWYLNWNTVSGGIYQVETSTDLVHWNYLGAPRFAAGNSDSIYLGLATQGYYQIVRYRY